MTSNSRTAAEPQRLDRKVCVPISMPETMLADIDWLRGDLPRSVFVRRLLRAQLANAGKKAQKKVVTAGSKVVDA